ncbi:hypothetical protein EZV62_011851 [Acer yangbiense]|uniref:DUF1279 domain-containing protein n=1 Tax=Acer yangbiense TaxID=1000413 RepID=A0A5C7I6P1_9ROSI|nr:hypothetical protein EZV62_011851 [Acer yangbiense]
MAGGRFKELLKKYGKVAFGVHFSVSGASIAGLFVAIKNNVDVESIFAKFHLPGVSSKDPDEVSASSPDSISDNSSDFNGGGGDFSGNGKSTVVIEEVQKKRNRTAELAASTGGALALAVLCNKALLPVRIPITIALTPPVARLEEWRNCSNMNLAMGNVVKAVTFARKVSFAEVK